MNDRDHKIFDVLINICENLAWDRPSNEDDLFRLTEKGVAPDDLGRLAESFGLMLVKLEARRIHRENLIRELEASNLELEKARNILARRNLTLNQAIYESYGPNQLVGQCPAIRQVADLALSIARRPINTLILGPTGSGKEVVAKMIHYNSPRREGPFIAVNCSAIAETLFESEMFGIDKGVATGVAQRRGLIESANGGTLFLDELGELSPSGQAKLLRVLEEREVVRVGGSKPLPVDINVISATNVDLLESVQAKRFREDLYYRLNVAEVLLPPLRRRGDDILILAALFLNRHAARLGRPPLSLSKDAAGVLSAYGWPGNVRELNNEMERAAALAVGEVISPEDLSPRLLEGAGAPGRPTRVEERKPPEAEAGIFKLEGMERLVIIEAMERHGGNKTRAARELGLSREGLRKKLKRLNLD